MQCEFILLVLSALPTCEPPRGQVVRDAERLVITEIFDFADPEALALLSL
jgi:hypothetical protein